MYQTVRLNEYQRVVKQLDIAIEVLEFYKIHAFSNLGERIDGKAEAILRRIREVGE